MSGFAGNLTYPKKPLLYNTIDTTKFGVFTDSVTGQKQLLFKGKGFSLPYKDAAGVIVGKVSKVSMLSWTAKVALVLLPSNCPCEDCNHEYGFSVSRIVKDPGVLNTERYEFLTNYGGFLQSITCTNGVIDSAYLTTMRNDIIDQITNHKRWSDNGFDAWVKAGIAKIVTWNSGRTLTIGSTAITVGASRAAFITNVNTGTTTHGVTAYADPSSATGVVLVTAAGTKTITLAATGGGTIMTVDANDYIGITGIETDINFNIVDPSGTVTATTIVENVFSTFTADDVYRTFSHLQHDGDLANQHRVEKPNNAAYTKYIFEILSPTAGFHGASSGHTNHLQIEIYVLTSQISGNKWDAANFMWESTADDGGFTADTTLDALFGIGGSTGWKS